VEGLGLNPNFWRGKRVFVTGSTGFKGAWLCYWLHSAGADVRGFALAPEGNPNLYKALALEELVANDIDDVRDREAVGKALLASRCDVVFHLAAQPLVRASYDDPLYTYSVNVMGTANVLEAARHNDALRAIVCVTTDKCYENREWVWPYRESDALGGRDPYSSSKACAEIVASAYSRSFFSGDSSPGLATARGGNVIGGGDWSVDRIVPDMVRAFRSGVPAEIRNPDAVRPWQFVLDALDGYLTLAERLYERPREYSQAWNFGPTSEYRVGTIADRFRDAWGNGARWVAVSREDFRKEAALLKLDSSKARSRLGWTDRFATPEAIEELAGWYTGYYGGTGARELTQRAIDRFAALATERR
jgi:CDP-glucose 4,6-dehydratase